MEGKLKILLLEDSETDADLLIRFLRKECIDFSHSRVWNREGFVSEMATKDYDLIIADHTLPQFSGMEAFRIAKIGNQNIPFILVTGTVSEKVLTEYTKEGIDDYILKENLLRLPSAIENVINKRKIEHLHKKLEHVYKDINDSINYAKKIQNAMLPDTALLSDNFPESFILFKPKDTLSGDFYWFKKEESVFLIAAADCTGHGIPGALMSMIGMEKLNNVTLQTKDPSKMLRQLNKSIEIALCQSTHYEHSHDGMDIALCSINKTQGIVKFAGANRQLWIVRNGTAVVEEIKGTKKAIGGLATVTSPNFDSHEIKLNRGDSIYIFSDGYSDQFGGINEKKLTSKGFKQVLLDIQEKTMGQQETYLNDFIEGWKANSEQVDDILVIGIRL